MISPFSLSALKYIDVANLLGLGSRCSGLAAEHWTRNRQGAGLTLTWFTASNLERVANLLCAQANSASYPQRDGK